MTNDGRAFVAGWIIKLLAGALLMASIAWAQYTTATNNKQSVDIAVIQEKGVATTKQLDRIEAMVGELLMKENNRAH